MTGRGRSMVFVAVFVAVAAAACTSSDEGDTSTGASTTAGASTTTDESSSAVDSTTTVGPAGGEVVELTASYRGVTEDTITLAYPTIDFPGLNEGFGLELTFSEFGPPMQVLVDDLNDRGGVLGRQLVVLDLPYLPVGTTTAEEVCVKIIDDSEVFAVVGGFAGTSVDANLCFGLADHILIGGLPTADQMEAAPVPWITTGMSPSRRAPAFVDLLDQTGRLGELGTVAIMGLGPSEFDAVARVEAAFTDAGTSVAFTTSLDGDASDEIATYAEVDVILEKLDAENVDSVVFVGVVRPLAIARMFENAPDLTYLYVDGDSISSWTSDPVEELSPDTVVLTSREPEPVDDSAVIRCVELVEAALGIEVKPPSQLAEGETNHWSGTIGACRLLAVFDQLATAAGAELTNDSFTQALDEVPDLVTPGWSYSSFSGDKRDARDSLALARWDAALGDFEILSEAFDVS